MPTDGRTGVTFFLGCLPARRLNSGERARPVRRRRLSAARPGARVAILVAILVVARPVAVGAAAAPSSGAPSGAGDCRPGPVPYAGIAGASLSPEVHVSSDPTPIAYVRWRGTAPSFDGMPLSVDVTVPCGATGPRPTVVMV